MIGLATDKRPAHISNDFAIGEIGNTISYSPYWRRENVNLLHGNQLSNTEMNSFLSKYIACFKVSIYKTYFFIEKDSNDRHPEAEQLEPTGKVTGRFN